MAVYSDSGYITGRDTPLIRPTLDLNFAKEKRLDSRVLFTRGSSGTYTDENGIIRTAANNVPRFDHDPVTGESLGLLIEESRTNLITLSNNFTEGTYWTDPATRWSSSLVTNIAPDGSTNVWKITRTSGDALLRKSEVSVTSGAVYTFSAYFKSLSGSTSIQVDINDLNTGSQTIYTDRWVRLSFTVSAPSTSVSLDISIVGAVGGDEYLIWGAQLELGSFPTSYIPTSGSTVPRAADLASISGTNFTDFYNASEGTLYASFVPVPVSSLSCVASIASSNTNAFGIYSYNTYQLRNAVSNNSNVLLDVGTVLGGDTNKIAGTMKLNDFAASLNGGTVGTDTDGALQSTPNTTFHIGTFGGANQYTGRIKQLSYYPRRLSDAQLRALTS